MSTSLENILNGLFQEEPDTPEAEKLQLKKQIAAVRQQISQTEDLFNYALNDAITEASIYQLKALNGYLDYLLKRVRGKDVTGLIFSSREQEMERIGGIVG